ncbi:hypothetical protein TTHERM_01414120 (macronuclear) [Tetrahymena thermophila SB210]|uniref:Uncharacterized protein n=1 Tax=Tetrahymena thermophila (strain SB210) TaxID=312017 RepID=Q23XH6_TETTS|nr:hypothetical protein TTHERM_01414120 [Tetrahymena thermophila SB210]EAS01231.3 hypothetical protein TTHERM_01414120 [Tetrahymena thermophila SB210]|eukprot:XP_001021476.3 hypothetical protein TTHERM_01414120 [Tetrahymena thermophila SB210]
MIMGNIFTFWQLFKINVNINLQIYKQINRQYDFLFSTHFNELTNHFQIQNSLQILNNFHSLVQFLFRYAQLPLYIKIDSILLPFILDFKFSNIFQQKGVINKYDSNLLLRIKDAQLINQFKYSKSGQQINMIEIFYLDSKMLNQFKYSKKLTLRCSINLNIQKRWQQINMIEIFQLDSKMVNQLITQKIKNSYWQITKQIY